MRLKRRRAIEPKKNPDPYAFDDAAPDTKGTSAPPGEKPKTAGFTATPQGGALIVTFEQANVLDAFEIEKLGDAIYHRIKPLNAPKVVIDLGQVRHLSSSSLGMLIALRQVVVQKMGGALAIANVNKDLRSIFKMTKLDRQLTLCDSTEKAIRKLA